MKRKIKPQLLGKYRELEEEFELIRSHDPAIHSIWEVNLYPYYIAMKAYRKAHKLYAEGHYYLARRLSQKASRRTGIEIHPGATIGKNFFIDHGTGVVIGETAEIGDNVFLYHGVTLGGTGKDTGKRHPTIGNNVMIGAESVVLGPVNIGDNVVIGAKTVVMTDIPPNTTVIGAPMRVVKRRTEEGTYVYDRHGKYKYFVDNEGVRHTDVPDITEHDDIG